jgi:hypothetical protein
MAWEMSQTHPDKIEPMRMSDKATQEAEARRALFADHAIDGPG